MFCSNANIGESILMCKVILDSPLMHMLLIVLLITIAIPLKASLLMVTFASVLPWLVFLNQSQSEYFVHLERSSDTICFQVLV